MFKNHPKGLLAAALSNMGERFGYYIMNAVLVLFLCSKFGLPEEKATAIYSVFYMGIYILSLVGGIIADVAPSYRSEVGRLCLNCGSDRIRIWDKRTCPKCQERMDPTGEKEFWT